jgi:hypothetical protein
MQKLWNLVNKISSNFSPRGSRVGRPNFLDEAVNTWNRIGSMGSIPNPLLRSTPWPDIATCLCRRTGGLHRRPELFPRAYALEESPGRRVPGMAPFASPSAAGLSAGAASATARWRQRWALLWWYASAPEDGVAVRTSQAAQTGMREATQWWRGEYAAAAAKAHALGEHVHRMMLRKW